MVVNDQFPCRARIGHTNYGLDADYWDHRQRSTPDPELVVTEPDVVGILWAPRGNAYREVLDYERVPFGFKGERT